MVLFNKSRNLFLKVFKIVDQTSARDFPIADLLLKSIELIEDKSGLKAQSFDVNYTKKRKTLKGFKELLDALPEIVYAFAGFGDVDKTDTFLTASNPMLNIFTEFQPQNSNVELEFQVRDDILDSETVTVVAEHLINQFNFDYGFIHAYPRNIDLTTEARRGFLGFFEESNEKEKIWNQHQVAILHGFIKKLYTINFLNSSQLGNPIIEKTTAAYGTLENLNERIKKWSLTKKELEELLQSDEIKQVCIVTKNLGFLSHPRATEFRKLTELVESETNNR